jgi:hypothetical protein
MPPAAANRPTEKPGEDTMTQAEKKMAERALIVLGLAALTLISLVGIYADRLSAALSP